MDPLQFPDLSESVVLQKTQFCEAHAVSVGIVFACAFGSEAFANSSQGVVVRVWMKFSEVHVLGLSFTLHEASSSPGHSMLLRSAAIALEAENRKGMPKLDSEGMDSRLELTKAGGAEHWLHLVLLSFAASIIVSSGVLFSLLRVSEVPSSHATEILE
jgi:hypothetical protein